MSKFYRHEKDPNYLVFYCPGCKRVHVIDASKWNVSGSDKEHVTITPSILVNGDLSNPSVPRCHMFIKNGVMEYLSDCTHELKGKNIPMVDIEDYWPEKE